MSFAVTERDCWFLSGVLAKVRDRFERKRMNAFGGRFGVVRFNFVAVARRGERVMLN